MNTAVELSFDDLINAVVRSIQHVSTALATYCPEPKPVAPAPEEPVPPVIFLLGDEFPVIKAQPAKRMAPVLTIPIAELQKARSPQRPKPRRPQRHTRQERVERSMRRVEVIYRRGFKLVS
jgi:hypothetical protein